MLTAKEKHVGRTAIEITVVVVIAALMLGPKSALAQQMGVGTACSGMMMSGPWGIFSGILGTVFVLSAIAAMVALAIYLVRRSRSFEGPRQT